MDNAVKSQLHCLCFATLHLILTQKMAASSPVENPGVERIARLPLQIS